MPFDEDSWKFKCNYRYFVHCIYKVYSYIDIGTVNRNEHTSYLSTSESSLTWLMWCVALCSAICKFIYMIYIIEFYTEYI